MERLAARRARAAVADAGRTGVAGFGAFNLVEGALLHLVLALHRLREDVADPLPWDLAYIGSGVLLLVGGLALARSAERRAARAG